MRVPLQAPHPSASGHLHNPRNAGLAYSRTFTRLASLMPITAYVDDSLSSKAYCTSLVHVGLRIMRRSHIRTRSS